MAKFCGGIKLDNTFKVIKGIICDANATTVDATKAVSTYGQRWDGDLFTIANVGDSKVVTLHNSEGNGVGEAVVAKGNCGVGLDGRFFKLNKGVVSLQDGFLLTVNATPDTASIKVVDADSVEVSPVAGKTNVFLLSGIGDQYGVNVEKEGYTGKHLTIINNKDQTLNVELVENPQG